MQNERNIFSRAFGKVAAALSLAPTPSVLVEQTGRQIAGRSGVSSGGGGSGEAPPPGTFATYRKMRENPTIALARAVATMPVKGGKWSIQAQDGVNDDAVKAVEEIANRLWTDFCRSAMYALDYGFQAFEVVWGADESNAARLTVQKLKPLMPELTTILVDKVTGEYSGLQQGKVTLPLSNTALYSYDREGQNYYGRSRMENIRTSAYNSWQDTRKKQSAHLTKNSGAVPMVRYPVGTSSDRSGGEKDNFDLATALLENLGKGNGVAMPWQLQPWAEDALRRGVSADLLTSWQISFLETRPGYGAEYQADLAYSDSLMMRGWLVPERSALEGKHGTLAEASAHGDLAVSVAEEVFADIVEVFNAYVVQPFMAANYGPSARHAVKLKPSPLVDSDKAFMRTLVNTILSQPNNLDLFLATVDFDAALDQAAIPKAKQVVDAATVPTPNAPGTQPQPGNPNPPAPQPTPPVSLDGSPASVAASNAMRRAIQSGAKVGST